MSAATDQATALRAGVWRERYLYFRDRPEEATRLAREFPPPDEPEIVELDQHVVEHARLFSQIRALSIIGGRVVKAVVVTLL